VVSSSVTWHARGRRCGVVVGDMAHGVASSLVTWHSIVVVGDVGHERVAVVASSSVMWHARGCWGCVIVGGVAVERVAAVLMWHTKRPRLAATVTWRIVGLWMHDEVGGGGQQGAQLTWALVCSRSQRRRRLRIGCHRRRIGCRRRHRVLEVVASLGLRWQRRWGGGVIGVEVVASLWSTTAVTRGRAWWWWW